MNINFSPVDKDYIKEKVENGYYSNATELVRDAVRHMRHQDNSKRARLDAALKQGEQDIAAGRTVTYTPSLLDKIEQNARLHAHEGKRHNPDVIP